MARMAGVQARAAMQIAADEDAPRDREQGREQNHKGDVLAQQSRARGSVPARRWPELRPRTARQEGEPPGRPRPFRSGDARRTLAPASGSTAMLTTGCPRRARPTGAKCRLASNSAAAAMPGASRNEGQQGRPSRKVMGSLLFDRQARRPDRVPRAALHSETGGRHCGAPKTALLHPARESPTPARGGCGRWFTVRRSRSA
jgi:hypothetical protein